MFKTILRPRLLIVAVMMMLAAATLTGQSTMRMFHTGSFGGLAIYNKIAVEGDSLASYDYQFVGRNFQLLRQAVSPDLGPLPVQTILDYNIDTAWGAISSSYPYFQYHNGKLYTAVLTESKILVFVTTQSATAVHVLDITGLNFSYITSYNGVSNLIMKDANIGYLVTGGTIPSPLSKYYVMDLTTDTLRMFYQSTEYSMYLLLNQGYVLLLGQYTTFGGNWLVDGESVIQELNSGYPWDDTRQIEGNSLFGDRYNSLIVGSGLEESYITDNNVVATVENQELQILGICSNMVSPFVATGDSTFCYIDTRIEGQTGSVISSGFKNMHLSANGMTPVAGFPHLEGFASPITLLPMGADYFVAVSGNWGQAMAFTMVDIPQQRIATDYYTIVCNYYHDFISTEHQVYFFHSNGLDIFHRDYGLGVEDDVIPEPILRVEASPNPFKDACKIGVTTAKDSRVKVSVYNLRGQLTRTLYDGWGQRGSSSYQWDGRNEQKHKAAAGIYWIRVETPGSIQTRKVVLIH